MKEENGVYLFDSLHLLVDELCSNSASVYEKERWLSQEKFIVSFVILLFPFIHLITPLTSPLMLCNSHSPNVLLLL